MMYVLGAMIVISYTLVVWFSRDVYEEFAPVIKRMWARWIAPLAQHADNARLRAECELWERALHHAKKRADDFQRRGRIVSSREIFALALQTQERMRNMYAVR